MDGEAQELLFQGWLPDVTTQAACQASSSGLGSVPAGEAIVRLPARMVLMIREACDAIEHAGIR